MSRGNKNKSKKCKAAQKPAVKKEVKSKKEEQDASNPIPQQPADPIPTATVEDTKGHNNGTQGPAERREEQNKAEERIVTIPVCLPRTTPIPADALDRTPWGFKNVDDFKNRILTQIVKLHGYAAPGAQTSVPVEPLPRSFSKYKVSGHYLVQWADSDTVAWTHKALLVRYGSKAIEKYKEQRAERAQELRCMRKIKHISSLDDVRVGKIYYWTDGWYAVQVISITESFKKEWTELGRKVTNTYQIMRQQDDLFVFVPELDVKYMGKQMHHTYELRLKCGMDFGPVAGLKNSLRYFTGEPEFHPDMEYDDDGEFPEVPEASTSSHVHSVTIPTADSIFDGTSLFFDYL